MGKPTWASLNRSGYEGYHQYCLHSTRRKGERSGPQRRICKIRKREGSGQGTNEITEERIVTRILAFSKLFSSQQRVTSADGLQSGIQLNHALVLSQSLQLGEVPPGNGSASCQCRNASIADRMDITEEQAISFLQGELSTDRVSAIAEWQALSEPFRNRCPHARAR